MDIIYSRTSENGTDYLDERRKEFLGEAQDVLNKKVWPYVKDKIKTASLFQGFFVSDEYGQYKIEFYDENKSIVLEVILDIVCGEMQWKY